MSKKIVFLTGTRADFGKLKSLITICQESSLFSTHVFVTGMHLQTQYGYTVLEIEDGGFKNIHKFINHTSEGAMDRTLAKTVDGFSHFISEVKPDLIVIHGDRVEALAGAIVGALNNILVAHIEGGELSGTIDELIRHSVSKLSHIHFVSNDWARQRLQQMGEFEQHIFVIGSPDVDLMLSKTLPSLNEVRNKYEINFENYAVVLFHPVTTEIDDMARFANQFVQAILESSQNFVVIYPNNDLGSSQILKAYDRLKNNDKVRVFPSIRFEYFLVLLKHAQFILGNSSAGIREAPYYGLPTVNVGTRQQNRALNDEILNTSYEKSEILNGIEKATKKKIKAVELYGDGQSDELFFQALKSPSFWKIEKQKKFIDLK